MTTMPSGTAKSLRFAGSFPPDRAQRLLLGCVRAGDDALASSGSRCSTRRSRRPRACAWTCARSAYSDARSTGSPRIEIDGPVSESSRSKSSSCAVVPMISAAACGSWTPGSWMTIWSSPCVRISGSETPSLSTRFRMISTERSRSSSVSSRFGGGTAWSVTSRPPCRSRPSVGDLWSGEPGIASKRDADERRDEQPEDEE